ncbi:MAG: pilus assembly protein PilX [Lachnospiraceae bacterium]|nr:pilus assembly protein PilX [Lachnospiraceae bacterium]
MRKWNAILSAAILILFVAHGVIGGFQLAGLYPGGSRILKMLARALATLIVIHGIIGIKLTVDTLRIQKKAGVSYFKENKLFWARCISGFAIFILIFFHMALFIGHEADGVVRLNPFEMPQLILHLILVLAIAVHVISNVRPVLISFGIRSLKQFAADLIIISAILLVFMGAMFVIYYFRWIAV